MDPTPSTEAILRVLDIFLGLISGPPNQLQEPETKKRAPDPSQVSTRMVGAVHHRFGAITATPVAVRSDVAEDEVRANPVTQAQDTQSLFDRLPPEIQINIFVECVAARVPAHRWKQAESLSLVSSHWRCLTYDAPQLWAAINIAHPSAVSTGLERSRDLPLDVAYSFVANTTSTDLVKANSQRLVAEGSRIRSLTIRTKDFTPFKLLLETVLPNLEEARFTSPAAINPDFVLRFSGGPKLRFLDTTVPVNYQRSDFGSLTKFKGGRLSCTSREITALLHASPLIETIAIAGLFHVGAEPPALSTLPAFHRPFLTSLRLSSFHPITALPLLTALRAENLAHLSLTNSMYNTHPANLFYALGQSCAIATILRNSRAAACHISYGDFHYSFSAYGSGGTDDKVIDIATTNTCAIRWKHLASTMDLISAFEQYSSLGIILTVSGRSLVEVAPEVRSGRLDGLTKLEARRTGGHEEALVSLVQALYLPSVDGGEPKWRCPRLGPVVIDRFPEPGSKLLGALTWLIRMRGEGAVCVDDTVEEDVAVLEIMDEEGAVLNVER